LMGQWRSPWQSTALRACLSISSAISPARLRNGRWCVRETAPSRLGTTRQSRPPSDRETRRAAAAIPGPPGRTTGQILSCRIFHSRFAFNPHGDSAGYTCKVNPNSAFQSSAITTGLTRLLEKETERSAIAIQKEIDKRDV